MSSANREIKDLLDQCVRQGGILTKTGNDHWKVIPPDKTKPIVYSSGTPSDFRSIRNIRAKLRRAGFIV